MRASFIGSSARAVSLRTQSAVLRLPLPISRSRDWMAGIESPSPSRMVCYAIPPKVESKEAELVPAEDEDKRVANLATWVGLATAFGAGIWYTQGGVKAQEYFAGYLLGETWSCMHFSIFGRLALDSPCPHLPMPSFPTPSQFVTWSI